MTVSASITPSETVSETETPPSTTPTQATPSLTPTPTCPGADYSPAYTPYTQFDSRWASNKMPTDNTTLGPNKLPSGRLDPHTIQSDGCFMTCLTMVANGYDPGTADSSISDNDDIYSSGKNNGNLKPSAANDVGLSIDASYSANVNNVPQAISESDFVIARVTHGGRTHYVLITGSAYNPATHNCDYTIADPGTANHSYLSQYSVNMLVEVNGN